MGRENLSVYCGEKFGALFLSDIFSTGVVFRRTDFPVEIFAFRVARTADAAVKEVIEGFI